MLISSSCRHRARTLPLAYISTTGGLPVPSWEVQVAVHSLRSAPTHPLSARKPRLSRTHSPYGRRMAGQRFGDQTAVLRQ